jgi:transposase
MMLEELSQGTNRIKQVEVELKKIADKHPGVMLLRTIPGVGIRTAEAFVAYIDDIRRFSRLNKLGAYLGLVPCQDATGDVNRLGHITRDGPSTIRKLLCEAAWQSVRRDQGMKEYFERLMRNDADRKKIALVACAHRLARIMGAMLRSGEVYRREAYRMDIEEGEREGEREEGEKREEGKEKGVKGLAPNGIGWPSGARSASQPDGPAADEKMRTRTGKR